MQKELYTDIYYDKAGKERGVGLRAEIQEDIHELSSEENED